MTPHPTHPSDIAPLWIADGKQIRPKRDLYDPEDTSMKSYANYCIQRGDKQHTYPCTLEPGEYPAETLRFMWEYFDLSSNTWQPALPSAYEKFKTFQYWKYCCDEFFDTRRSITAK